MGLLSSILGLGSQVKKVASWIGAFLDKDIIDTFTPQKAEGLGAKVTEQELKKGKEIIAGTLKEWESMKFYPLNKPVVKGYVQTTRQNDKYKYSTVVEVISRDTDGKIVSKDYVTINHNTPLTRNEMVKAVDEKWLANYGKEAIYNEVIPREGYINKSKQEVLGV